MKRHRPFRAGLFALLALGVLFFRAERAAAGIVEQWFPLPAAKNRFITDHAQFGRMLWAFDYGHALIYEQLWQNSLTGDFDFSFIEGPLPDPQRPVIAQVMDILASPPTQAPAEESLSPHFTLEYSWLMNMFAWTHKLHWIVADVLEGESPERAKAILKDQAEAYRRFPSLALPTKCKSMMTFMEGLPFSMRFRRNSPTANGLIWAYHYYQLAIYEGLLLPPGPQRDALLRKVLRTFSDLAEDPATKVAEMPMAKKVAPNFYKQFPELAAIFDNLHEVHDVVGDILSISEPLKLSLRDKNGKEDEIVKLGVPDSIKVKIPGDPDHVMVYYDQPDVKKAQMNHAMKIALDETTFIIDCDKNGHID